MQHPSSQESSWPEIPYPAWAKTCATLQLVTQIVGKVRLAQTPWLNHSWHVTLYVTPRGLTTGPIPFGSRSFQIDLDLLDHRVRVETSDGTRADMALAPRSIATFYAELLGLLAGLDLPVRIDGSPNEIVDAVPFAQNTAPAVYDAEAVTRFHGALLQADRVLKEFRTSFIGKASPVHFFWGSFDLAVTRFSGRRAPPHPGGVPALPDAVVREAYSHEVSSAGFWPGGGAIDYPAFYAYAYPEPPGFRTAAVRPEAAFFSTALSEFILPYDAVRTAADPDATLLAFLEDTYAAAADAANWDRAALECALGRPGVPRPA
jgi:hypothetical protein